MKINYIYVFDYTFGRIYEIKLKEEEFSTIKNIEVWLFKNYRIDCRRNCDYMISNKKLEIETLEKV